MTTHSSTTNADTTEKVKSTDADVNAKAKSAAHDVKATAKDIAQQTQRTAQDAVADVKAAASEAAQHAREKASELTDDAQQKAESFAAEQKSQAAAHIEGVASALRQSGQEFRTHDQETFAHYTDSAAEQIERVSSYLRNRDVNELVGEVRRFAYQQPEIFIAGALAAGFFLGRFLKSSSPAPRSHYQNDNYQVRRNYSGSDYGRLNYDRPGYGQAAGRHRNSYSYTGTGDSTHFTAPPRRSDANTDPASHTTQTSTEHTTTKGEQS